MGVSALKPQSRKMSDSEILEDIARMVRDALQARVALIQETSSAVEYETSLVRDRLSRDGINANLRALRSGEHYKRTTEFEVLQSIHRAINARLNGEPISSQFDFEEEQDD